MGLHGRLLGAVGGMAGAVSAALLLNSACSWSPDRQVAPTEWVVSAGPVERWNTPVAVPLTGAAEEFDGVRLLETTGGQMREVPIQVETGPPPTLHWILDGITPPDAERTFRVVLETPTFQGEADRLETTDVE